MRFRQILWRVMILFCGSLVFSSAALSNECVDLHGAQRFKQALSVCQSLAKGRDPSSLFTLGLMYFYGQAVPQSQPDSLSYFKQAARMGHAGAQNNLGYFYYNGLVVKQDYVRAFLWFSLSAAEGFAEAASFRDAVALHLGKDQMLQAQAMAQACRNSHFEMCE